MDGLEGAGLWGERWVWGPEGTVPPLRSCCGCGELWGHEVIDLLVPSRPARLVLPVFVLLILIVASSQSAEREDLGEPRVRWPGAPGPPCSGILLAGFPALQSSLRLRSAAGFVPPAVGMLCREYTSAGSNLGAGRDLLLPRAERGPCPATFLGSATF